MKDRTWHLLGAFWKECAAAGLLLALLDVGVRAQAPPTATPNRRLVRERPPGAGRALRPGVTEVRAGTLQGLVTDRTGAALPGVRCIVASAEREGEQAVVTDSEGRYRIAGLPPGAYRVRFSLPGFFAPPETFSVGAAQITTVNATMQRGMVLPRVELPPPAPPPPPATPVSAPTPQPSPPPPATPVSPPDREPTRPPTMPRNGRPAPIRELYWNSWIESRNGEAVSRIELNQTYTFDFDMAAFNYRALGNFPATESVALGREIREELDSYTGNTARFYVKPILGGKGLAFLPRESEVRRVEADLTRLRNPPTGWSRNDPLPALSQKLRAAQIRIEVKAEGEGCAAIGLSIWNDAMDRPIDHLVREVYVGGDVGDARCGAAEPSKALRGSLVSLLTSTPNQEAAAALHIFEMAQNDPRSFAVFKKRDGPLLTWILERRLSQFVSEATGLVSRLNAARTGRDYRIVGRPLTDVVFHGSTPEGQRQADKALELLSELASGPVRPVVFARLVGSDGENLFLPLGLIVVRTGPAAAEATERFLGDVVTVTQPLPRNETYSAGERCIGGWTMVLPENLGAGVDAGFLTPVTAIPDRISQWPRFESYWRDQPSDPSKGEGLLLLAHHAGGQVWFVQGPDVMLSENISRRYPRGSVAVLSACSLGDVADSSSGVPLLEKLNGLGIDAAIVSPFAVQGPVGARFAFHFANEILKAREQRDDVDLTSLFRRVMGAVRADESVSAQKDAVYEFVLAGNGGLKLCR